MEQKDIIALGIFEAMTRGKKAALVGVAGAGSLTPDAMAAYKFSQANRATDKGNAAAVRSASELKQLNVKGSLDQKAVSDEYHKTADKLRGEGEHFQSYSPYRALGRLLKKGQDAT